MRKIIILALVSATAILITGTVCVLYLSPLDLGGKQRVVAERKLPNGDRLQVVQYWNDGDFYNLEMRHLTSSGAQYECVIDPDCLRVAKCTIVVDPRKGEARIKATHGIEASYHFELKRLMRKNGVAVEAEVVR